MFQAIVHHYTKRQFLDPEGFLQDSIRTASVLFKVHVKANEVDVQNMSTPTKRTAH